MMYGNKLAAAIKVNGKVLREFKDTTYIPFGSEYSILVKNLNSVKCIVNVYIDGENAVPGGLVIDPGREVDLERWIKNSNMSEGNKFKFIERSAGVEKHRGVKLEDGLIRIEHQFEKRQPVINWNDYSTFNKNIPNWPNQVYGQPTSIANAVNNPEIQNVLRGIKDGTINLTASGASGATYSTTSVNAVNVSAQAFVNDVGITVPGSKSDQKFQIASWFPTETETHSMVIRLLGETPDNKPVVKPVTVKAKPKCTSCGRQNKAHAKFCVECGTALEIFA